jgi:hypothetical protein
MKYGVLGACIATVLVAAVAPGCYAGSTVDAGNPLCNPGYASCPNTGHGSGEQCETYVVDDPQNCGSCGNACPMGAVCANGACTTPPVPLAMGVSTSQLGIDSSDVFYWTSSGALEAIQKSGPSMPYTISLPGSPQAGGVFAVDDSGVYYFSQNGSMGPTIDRVATDGTSPAPTIIATFTPSSLGGASSLGNVSDLLLSGTTLYWLGSVSLGSEAFAIPESGGSPRALAGPPGNNYAFPGHTSIAIDSQSIYVIGGTGGSGGGSSCSFLNIPLTSGSGSQAAGIRVGQINTSCDGTLATDGTNLYFTATSTTSQNCNGNGPCNQECVSAVYSVPVGGGSANAIAQLTGDETGIALVVDGGDLYDLTQESLWRIPTAGGTPTQLAGNLQIGSSGGQCGGLGNNQGNPLASMVLDANDVYFAIPSGLYKLPR